MLERYELSAFLEYKSQLSPALFAMEPKLSNLMKRAEYPLVGHAGIEWRERIAVPFYLNLERATVANVGRILLDFDMEARRTTSFQLRASIVLPKKSEFMTMINTQSDDELRIALALSNDLRLALTTQPIDFLLTLDWFWDFRYSQSRVRSPIGQRDPHERWRQILSSASECTTTSTPVAAEMVIGSQGTASFGFRSAESR